MIDNVFVYKISLPVKIREAVMPCPGGYTVYINDRISHSEQIRAYRHALRHIERNDFAKANVQSIEEDNE